MSLYKQFKTDENIEKAGILLEYGPSSTGKPITFRIARAGGSNTKFAQLMDKKVKPYRRQLQNETLDPEIAEEIFREIYAEAVVLGWENVEDEEGKPLPFSKENCLKLFHDLPDLFADIREQAGKVALFRVNIQEIEAKN